MPLEYKVWTDKEIDERGLMPDGDYPFEISDITHKPTSKGNAMMLEIDLNYWDNNGLSHKLRDWITLVETMDWKLRKLCEAVGKLDIYEAKKLECTDLKGTVGVFNIGTKSYVSTKDGEEKKVNYVKDYIKHSVTHTQPTGPQVSNLDDDIPF